MINLAQIRIFLLLSINVMVFLCENALILCVRNAMNRIASLCDNHNCSSLLCVCVLGKELNMIKFATLCCILLLSSPS